MRAAFGMAGLLIVLAIGYFIYSSQIQGVTGDKPVMQKVNLISVRSDLLSLGQAEKLYSAAKGSYATLEQLRQSGVVSSVPESNRAGYRYTVELDDAAHFRITANPADPSNSDFPALSIDETLQISQ